jgi:hypothetical protein
VRCQLPSFYCYSTWGSWSILAGQAYVLAGCRPPTDNHEGPGGVGGPMTCFLQTLLRGQCSILLVSDVWSSGLEHQPVDAPHAAPVLATSKLSCDYCNCLWRQYLKWPN